MCKRFYLDTSIWLDYYLKRGVNGRFAKQLIDKLVLEGNTIIFSDTILSELTKVGLSKNEVYQIFKVAKLENIKFVGLSKEQIKEARKISKSKNIPFGDAIHSIIAKYYSCILVTRDNHFKLLNYLVTTKRPEELV